MPLSDDDVREALENAGIRVADVPPAERAALTSLSSHELTTLLNIQKKLHQSGHCDPNVYLPHRPIL